MKNNKIISLFLILCTLIFISCSNKMISITNLRVGEKIPVMKDTKIIEKRGCVMTVMNIVTVIAGEDELYLLPEASACGVLNCKNSEREYVCMGISYFQGD